MRWLPVLAGTEPRDLVHILAAAQSTGDPVPHDSLSVAQVLDESGTAGLLVIGDDAALASVVSTMRCADADVPIVLVPSRRSDLVRIFGQDRSSILQRLQCGASYRFDLGQLSTAVGEAPFVSHIVAEPSGIRRHVGPHAGVNIRRPSRDYHQLAWSVVVANAQHLSGHAIAPKASLGDGAFDLKVFAGAPARRPVTRRMAHRGLHLQRRKVWRRSVAPGSIGIPPSWTVRADGIRVDQGRFRVADEPAAFDLWI